MTTIGIDNGWTASAPAWIERYQADEHPERSLLLDPVMLREAGEVAGLRVLDVGCGEGRFSRMLAERGASVVGLDLTEPMVRSARARSGGLGDYLRASGEVLPLASERFDLAVVYLVLIDMNDFRAAIREAARVLRPGGRLLVANLSFVTASEGWLRDEEGRRIHHRLDRYLEERPILIEWAEGRGRIRNWHRPLSAYMETYLGAGLVLRRFIEPMPPDDSLRDDPRFEDWYRIPDFTVMVWEKPAPPA